MAFASAVPICWGAVGEFGRSLKSEICDLRLSLALVLPCSFFGGTDVLYLFWEVIPKQQSSKVNRTNLPILVVHIRSDHLMSSRNELTICMAQQRNDIQ